MLGVMGAVETFREFKRQNRDIHINIHILATNGEEGNDLGGTNTGRTLSWGRMPSGATHDGNAMAMKMPIAMVFVPSRDGISHNRNEYTGWDQVKKGITVLYDTLAAVNASAGIGKA